MIKIILQSDNIWHHVFGISSSLLTIINTLVTRRRHSIGIKDLKHDDWFIIFKFPFVQEWQRLVVHVNFLLIIHVRLHSLINSIELAGVYHISLLNNLVFICRVFIICQIINAKLCYIPKVFFEFFVATIIDLFREDWRLYQFYRAYCLFSKDGGIVFLTVFVII